MEIFCLPAPSSSPLTEASCLCFAALTRRFVSLLLTLGCDIASFQSLEAELSALPGRYCAANKGGLWLALVAHNHSGKDLAKELADFPSLHLGCRGPFAAVGCIALRDLGAGRGELKRMFVDDKFRRGGIGKKLVDSALACARELGYGELVLDTLGRLPDAKALYERTGFSAIPPYCENPCEDVFLGMRL